MSRLLPHVSALFRYPVKSCAPESMAHAVAQERGFAGDRRWMLVDAEGQFLSQRSRPELCRIEARPQDPLFPERGLRFRFLGSGLDANASSPFNPLLVHAPKADAPTRTVTIWGDAVSARLADPAAQDWIQSVLDPSVQLVYMGEDNRRPSDPDYAGSNREVSFADGYPYLILSQAAMDGLNERMRSKGEPALPIHRFRPNIVVQGCTPHAEDAWSRVQLGEGPQSAILRLVKPCARCRLTTLDTEGMVYGTEPLQTLAEYRQTPSGGPYGASDEAAERPLKGLFFGMNAVVERPGTVRAGDPVLLLDEGKPPSAMPL